MERSVPGSVLVQDIGTHVARYRKLHWSVSRVIGNSRDQQRGWCARPELSSPPLSSRGQREADPRGNIPVRAGPTAKQRHRRGLAVPWMRRSAPGWPGEPPQPTP